MEYFTTGPRSLCPHLGVFSLILPCSLLSFCSLHPRQNTMRGLHRVWQLAGLASCQEQFPPRGSTTPPRATTAIFYSFLFYLSDLDMDLSPSVPPSVCGSSGLLSLLVAAMSAQSAQRGAARKPNTGSVVTSAGVN